MRDRQIDRQMIDRQIILSFCVNVRVYIRVSKCYQFQHGNCNILLHTAISLMIKVEPLTTCIEQLIVRLDKFELVKRIREDPNPFRLTFCHSRVLIWTYDLFINSLIVNCSSEGSNKRMLETRVYRVFIEISGISFHDGIRFANILPISPLQQLLFENFRSVI